MSKGDYGTIEQMVYGSTAHSAGYSILGKSPRLDDLLCRQLITRSEEYDKQLHAAPPTPYSIAICEIPGKLHLMTEIFAGWTDQMGRASRVLRHVVIENTGWQILGGNPFLLLWLLPPVKRCISKKRNEPCQIPTVEIGNLSTTKWQRLWYREMRAWKKIIARLSSEQKELLLHFQGQKQPFFPLELPVQQDQFQLCRAISFSVPCNERLSLQCESFSLNQKTPAGITFRYAPYCQNSSVVQAENKAKQTTCADWEIATVMNSIPKPHNAKVLAMWWLGRQRLWQIACLLSALTGMIFIRLINTI